MLNQSDIVDIVEHGKMNHFYYIENGGSIFAIASFV